jgi:hypothetical protein
VHLTTDHTSVRIPQFLVCSLLAHDLCRGTISIMLRITCKLIEKEVEYHVKNLILDILFCACRKRLFFYFMDFLVRVTIGFL